MEFSPISKMIVKEEHNTFKDLTIFEDSHSTTKIAMESNDLASYFPEDVHMGLPYDNSQPGLVYKAVVKLPIDSF